MVKVFLCHSSKDKTFVRELARRLKSASVDVWLDEWEIGIGDSIVQKINSAIGASDYMLVVLSQASVGSKWVKDELSTAIVKTIEKGAYILPVLIEECNIPELLRHRRYANFKDNPDTAFDELVRTLRKLPPRDMLVAPDNPLSPENLLVETMGDSLAKYDPAKDIEQIRKGMRNIHKAIGGKLHMSSTTVLDVYVDLCISNGRALALREFIEKLGEAIPTYPERVQNELVNYLKHIISLG